MDLTPKQLIEDVEFREVRRGYDPAEVDAFLDRVAAAMGKLQSQLTDALARAQAAEANSAPDVVPASADEVAATEQLQRTLILAQRTADAAVKEAQEEAEALRSSAAAEAEAVRSGAAAEAETLRSGAAAEAERLVSSARTEAEGHAAAAREASVTELQDYGQVRASLLADIALLESHTEVQRSALRESIAALQAVLDDPAALRIAPVEGLEGVDLPTAAIPVVAVESDSAAELPEVESEPESAPAPEAEAEPEPEPASESEPEVVVVAPVAVDDFPSSLADPAVVADAAPETVGEVPIVSAEGGGSADATPSINEGLGSEETVAEPPIPAAEPVDLTAHHEANDDAWDTFAKAERTDSGDSVGALELDFNEVKPRVDGPPPSVEAGQVVVASAPAGPASETIDLLSSPEPPADDSDDAFLAELRKAMTDDEPLGPRDEDEPLQSFPMEDHTSDNRPRPRFGRRR